MGVAGRPCSQHGLNSAWRCSPDTGWGGGDFSGNTLLYVVDHPHPASPIKGEGFKGLAPDPVQSGAMLSQPIARGAGIAFVEFRDKGVEIGTVVHVDAVGHFMCDGRAPH